jgi:nucleotide-binding universal stress UspA family protein
MARILIAVDGSPAAQRALEFGAPLAAKLGVGVTLLHVIPQVVLPVGGGGPDTLAELQQSLQAEATQLLAGLADKARARGVAVETEQAMGDPAVSIYDRSEAPDIQLVVMGSRGQGTVARLLLGSVATKVVHTATRPVVVVRDEPGREAVRRILVAVDSTPVACEAARVGLELAERVGARVTLVHVLPHSVGHGEMASFAAFERACEDYAGGLLTELRLLTGRSGPPTDTAVLHGEPAEAISQAAAAEDVDLVIVGTRARGALARTLLGSVADTLLHQCPKPVMVVPEGPKRVHVREEDPEKELSEVLAPSV